MSGYTDNLSLEQKNALDQLRDNVKDVLRLEHDDCFLLRWLKARDFDVIKAEEMLRKHFEWYERHDVANILKWEPPAVLTRYVPGGFYGEDKEGHPNYYETSTLADIDALPYVCTHREVIKYKIRCAEYCQKIKFPELSRKYGRQIFQSNIIIDLTGLGPKFLKVLDIWTGTLQALEANYPESVHRIYIINAPKLFPAAYGLVKKFLSQNTIDKIVVCGRNWVETLVADIELTELPVHWGGAATDPDGDPCCSSQICMGGKIPDEYYQLKMLKQSPEGSKFTKATISRGSSLQLAFQIQRPNFVIKWRFWSERTFIDYMVTKKAPGQVAMEEVLPLTRYNSHLLPQSGSVLCEGPATYILTFDNTPSIIRAKEVHYDIQILDPQEAEAQKDVENSRDFVKY